MLQQVREWEYLWQVMQAHMKADKSALANWNALLFMFKEQHDWRRAVNVLKLVQSNNVKPIRVSFNVVVDTCGRAGQVDVAFDIFRGMQHSNVKPDHNQRLSHLVYP